MFTIESLENLRQKIDLFDVLSDYIDLKKMGASYKALCPFHQEKTPSFIVQRGDTHYHCFGCQAHGDAIQFLMHHSSLSFVEAVEMLADRFHVVLEKKDFKEEKGINKTVIKNALSEASSFFHEYLVNSPEGREPLRYLFHRGITIDFIRRFDVGFAPSSGLLIQVMKKEGFHDDVLTEAGLLSGSRPFFQSRITFPVHDNSGAIVGFSARKINEEVFGGKYINTQETTLFKKARILFGMNYSRRRIAKEKKVILVEGQIDCLKLIDSGLDLTVAALGTAFTEWHVSSLLQLGVREAYLLFDGDEAGRKAGSKVGDMLQKVGIEVFVTTLPAGSDPDSIVTKNGVERLIEILNKAENYLSFQVGFLGQSCDINSPAGKAVIVSSLKEQISKWEDPIMVHESLRKLASMMHIPEEMVGVDKSFSSKFYLQKGSVGSGQAVDPHRILELDLLRWLILFPEDSLSIVKHYLDESYFWVNECRELFTYIMKNEGVDLLMLASMKECDSDLIDEILRKKVNGERVAAQLLQTIQQLLDREWMHARESIQTKIKSGNYQNEELLKLVKEFDGLVRPQVVNTTNKPESIKRH